MKTLPNSLLIEGHTDATPYSSDAGYSNWDLSADRANSARRLLQQDGVRADQVTQVRGYADQMLRVKNNPTDPSNRRISILVKNGERCRCRSFRGQGGEWTAPVPGSSKAAEETARAKRAVRLRRLDTAATAPAAAPAKTRGTAAKPGLIARLKSMMPGAKK